HQQIRPFRSGYRLSGKNRELSVPSMQVPVTIRIAAQSQAFADMGKPKLCEPCGRLPAERRLAGRGRSTLRSPHDPAAPQAPPADPGGIDEIRANPVRRGLV